MAEPRSLRIVLCDDHLMLLEGLATALAERGHHIEAMSTSAVEVVEIVARLKPDVCVLDLVFADGNGVTAAEQILQRAPETKILILSAALTPEVIRRCIELGVPGFLRKDSGLADIAEALERLGSGQVAIDSELLREAMLSAPGKGGRGHAGPFDTLTERERQVLQRMAAGDDTRAIARSLNISTSTARSHVQNVLSKLGVHSRVQAVAYALTAGELGTNGDMKY